MKKMIGETENNRLGTEKMAPPNYSARVCNAAAVRCVLMTYVFHTFISVETLIIFDIFK